jgi:membrane protein implicated in regulation of membrane protease activity
VTDATKKKRELRWEASPRTPAAHPYRDSPILYAVLAGVVVGVTALTGGDMRAALILAPVLFVIATAYSWWRLRRRERERQEAETQEAESEE